MKGVIFNPINQKFDVKNAAQEHHSLCETPRWAKLQCHSGWHLVPQIRMCLRVHEKFTNFLEAHAFCNVKGSFIATAQNGNESDMLRSVINPYNLKNGLAGGVGGFWTGVKAEALTTFSMDGTKPTFKVEGDDPNAKGCGAITFRPFIADGREFGGEIVSCKKERDYDFWELPFMCQNFADQSLANNI
uniref:C-type lectin domain-containing protein n=1 Tax=Panagrolaimus superbus TaxID=310955 RepID=A0A914YKQ0_9BILA